MWVRLSSKTQLIWGEIAAELMLLIQYVLPHPYLCL